MYVTQSEILITAKENLKHFGLLFYILPSVSYGTVALEKSLLENKKRWSWDLCKRGVILLICYETETKKKSQLYYTI